jgi:peptidoglycan/xylan/chitin deacetylase (PgdA/CDA1 family)
VAGPLPHILARRREQRARRRRRRRVGALAAVAGVTAIAVLVAVLSAGGPTSRRRHRVLVAGPTSVSLRTRREAGGLRAVMAVGNAEIRRLVRFGLPVYCGGPRGDEVALTFDDGPGVYTHLALKKLRRAHERATFFDVGKSINGWPGYLPKEEALAAIGDHTYTHPDLERLAPADVISQLRRTAQLITAQSGQPVDLWRPPYEATDPAIDRIAQHLGLLLILWSVDSADSLGANWAQIIHRVETGLRPGAIVELHENRGQTIRALTTLLPYLHRRHLRSVSVPELLASDPPSVAMLRRGWTACGERPSALAGTGA